METIGENLSGSAILTKLQATNFSEIALKASVHYFLSKFYFSLDDSPSKTMKNVFYFI